MIDNPQRLNEMIEMASLDNGFEAIADEQDLVIVEIGVYKGKHTVELMEWLDVSKAYLIDPYRQYKDFFQSSRLDFDQKELDEAEVIAKDKMSQRDEEIVWINKFSNIAHLGINEKVDFVYIDGNHRYDWIMSDMEKYWSLVKDGGVMAGHDSDYPGASEALVEFCLDRDLEFGVTAGWGNGARPSDWWIEK